MSTRDKAENKAQEMKGRAKEWAGDVTDNESLQAEGARDRAAGRTKQAGERVKDAAHDVGEAFRS